MDTFPLNAHTTASDALRMELPVLTYRGESFSRLKVDQKLLQANSLFHEGEMLDF
tara:strand:+ start:336 stop:500 length:165 start_codon:yes stop_codon:yes gene_type:complete